MKGLILIAGLLFTACSFNYGPLQTQEQIKPDIVMEDIEYARVRGGDLLVNFQAEYAERWEDRQIMKFKNFTFEQMDKDTVNAEGRAGAAVVQTGSGDISLSDGVRINIESEDILIRTASLEWIDKEKHLFGEETNEVEIERSDGTNFMGKGFSSDARNRTWSFSGKVEGTYIENDDDEDSEEPGEKRVKIEWLRNNPDNALSAPGQYSHEEYTPEEYTSEEKKVIQQMLEEK